MAVVNPDAILVTDKETNESETEHKVENAMLTLPASQSDAMKLLSSVGAHVGLMMAYKSILAHRSPNVASIFLFGKSGAGKSSTLNHLFGRDLIPTSSKESCTRDVTEYGCAMESTHWRVDGLGLSFVDVPGYGDTEGVKQDAKNLATISEYVNTRFSKWTGKIYPNIVLVVVNGSDNRIFGIDSEFSRMLYILSQLNVVDRERPNVVIAVTHALNLRKKHFREKTRDIANNCAILSRIYLLFEAPVVFLENEDEDDELETEGDWKILPDGIRQPFNLYQAMMDLMKKSGDEVGVEAIRIFFSNAKDFKVERRVQIPQASSSTLNKSVSFWESQIKEKFLTSCSELHDILMESSHDTEMSFSQSEVMVLSHNLRRVKINKRADIENMKLEKIKQKLRPYVLNDKEICLLCKIFNLKPIDKLKFDLLGLGYSRKQEERKSRVLDISTKELSYEEGIFVPIHFGTEHCGAVSIDIKYTNENGLRYLFRMRTKKIKIEFTIRYLLFKVEMKETAKLCLNVEFSNFLKKCFSGDCCDNDPRSERQIPLKQFEDKYGNHCITGLHFGGSFNGSTWFQGDWLQGDKDKLIQHVGKMKSHLESYFDYLMSHHKTDQPPYATEDAIFDDLKKCQLTWKGGDKQFHSQYLGDLTPKSWYGWIDSLNDNVILLDGYVMTTTSLYNILNACPDEALWQHANYFESATSTQIDLNDLYYYTAPDIPTESGPFKPEAPDHISTRVMASEASKSKLCNII